MDEIAKTPISRNLWTIMKEFKVLPTDPTFQDLTEPQVGWIMASMNLDAEYQKLIRKGHDPDSYFKDSDQSWIDKSAEEFDPTDGLTLSEEEIQKQVDALTSEEDLRKAATRQEESEDWNEYLEDGGRDEEEENTEQEMQERFEKALREAGHLEKSGKSKWGKARMSKEEEEKNEEFEPMTEESVQEAFKLFQGEGGLEEEEEDNTNPDDGWI